jgi:hypothetical protein
MAGCGARIFFLTSPNAPTGVGFANAEIAGALRAFDGILVVDEAYAPFARENAAGLLAGHPNLVVLRTFSKAYALAGIRVGYALADPGVIALLDRVRDSYNVSRLSQAAALAALSDPGYYAGIIDKIKGMVHVPLAVQLHLHGARRLPRPHRPGGRKGGLRLPVLAQGSGAPLPERRLDRLLPADHRRQR